MEVTYQEFLEGKIDVAPLTGLDVKPEQLSPALKPHQRDSVLWALRGGRRALFAAFGLGKTVMQLEWTRIVAEMTGGRVLIVLPLNVRRNFGTMRRTSCTRRHRLMSARWPRRRRPRRRS